MTWLVSSVLADSEHSDREGDDSWRPDLALSQLLYMARSTFNREGGVRGPSLDGPSRGAAGQGPGGEPGTVGEASGAGGASAGSRGVSSPPRVSEQLG
jgi:hypothetical protein